MGGVGNRDDNKDVTVIADVGGYCVCLLGFWNGPKAGNRLPRGSWRPLAQGGRLQGQNFTTSPSVFTGDHDESGSDSAMAQTCIQSCSKNCRQQPMEFNDIKNGDSDSVGRGQNAKTS